MRFPILHSDDGLTHYASPKLLALYFVAISPSLGTAISAMGRLLLFCTALAVIALSVVREKPFFKPQFTWLTGVILVTIFYMGASVVWSEADLSLALNAWARHARLLGIVLVLFLIVNLCEARAVLRAFVIGQTFVVLSAWLLVLSIDLPWATSMNAKLNYSVFGSYLEQSISQSVLAAIVWFHRDWIFGKNGRWIAIALACTTMVLTLVFLQGRTGALVGLALIALAIIYALPRQYLPLAFVMPLLVVLVGMGSSKVMRDRFLAVKSEVGAYQQQSVVDSSSGQRLLFWKVSLEAASERPIFGHGAGSWNLNYRQHEAGRAPVSTLRVGDPHQLFLLWAVEGGLVGLALLLAVFVAIFNVTQKLFGTDAKAGQAVLLALVISSMLNSMIFGIGMGDFFCVAIGILLCPLTSTPALAVAPAQNEPNA